MNKEAAKAINRAEKNHPVRDWFKENHYNINKVLFFYVYIPVIIKEKRYKALQWDETKAQKILEYYVPRKAMWDRKDQCFYFFDFDMNNPKLIKRKDRRFWKKFSRREMRKYLKEKFELEGFAKNVLKIDWDDIEIIFEKV